jgi:hypothetical protein
MKTRRGIALTSKEREQLQTVFQSTAGFRS